jgi:hypothetical protein
MELRPDKTTIYSPTIPISALRRDHGLPATIPDAKIKRDGVPMPTQRPSFQPTTQNSTKIYRR